MLNSYFNNIYWHLWLDPDLRLIECLCFQIITIVTFIMSISSLVTIIVYVNKHKQIVCHWSIRFSIGILLLSIIISIAGFILLIYQQNGLHFNFQHISCKIVLILIAIFIVLIPMIVFISFNSYLKWKSVINNIKNINYKWYEIKTMDNDCNMDLRHLVAVNNMNKEREEKLENNLLLNEKTNEKITNKNDIDIILNAHKSRYKLHLFSFIGQLILFISVQYKNYNEQQNKLLLWGYRYSKIINEDEYYIAKWELENGIMPNPNEKFETLEWMEYIARNNMQNQ